MYDKSQLRAIVIKDIWAIYRFMGTIFWMRLLLPFAIDAAESRAKLIAQTPSLLARLSLRLDL